MMPCALVEIGAMVCHYPAASSLKRCRQARGVSDRCTSNMDALAHEDASSLPLGRPVRRRIGRRILALAVLGIACLGLALHRELRYYKVTSGSMQPTLQVGDRVSVDPGERDPR